MHVMLTVLGLRPVETTYVLDGQSQSAQLAPVALVRLLPQTLRPERLYALCTPAARKKTYPLLEEELVGCMTIEAVEVPEGHGDGDIDEFLRKVAQVVQPGADVILDLTHGFRHLSFLAYAAALYLSSLEEVRIRAMYYGMLRREEPETPFLDLTPLLLDLPRWFHGLEVLKKTGSAQVVADLLEERPSTDLRMIGQLRDISEAHASALPLELGRQICVFLKDCLKPLGRKLRKRRLPRAGEIVHRLKDLMSPLALVEPPAPGSWKKAVRLTTAELQRQRRLVDDLLTRENYPAALGLMNEWMVSWAAQGLGLEEGWLDYQAVRRKTAGLLGAMVAVDKDPALQHVLRPEQRDLAQFWAGLSELRNAFHHHGMRPQVLLRAGKGEFSKTLDKVLESWRCFGAHGPELELQFGKDRVESLLLTPLGRRPGVLYSALLAARDKLSGWPGAVRVVCSEESKTSIAEAADQAGFAGEIEPLVLEDPYGGREEIKKLSAAIRPDLVAADTVIVNITGGTTLMGLAVEAMSQEARKLARPVLRFGLIDRRRPVEQQADPYQAGEAFWIEQQEGRESGH